MAVCGAFIGAFDLECLFVNTFAGSATVFAFIAIIFIVMMAGRMRMFAGALGVSILLFGLLTMDLLPWFLPYVGFWTFVIVGIIIIGRRIIQ